MQALAGITVVIGLLVIFFGRGARTWLFVLFRLVPRGLWLLLGVFAFGVCEGTRCH